WTGLDAGDYIHFYAEQVHSAWNTALEEAEILVIRFYQLGVSGTRYTLIDELSSKRLSDRAVAEVIAALSPLGIRAQENQGVSDRIGFGRLLRLLCDHLHERRGVQHSLTRLAKRAKKLGCPFSRAKFSRVLNGETAVSVTELEQLARVFEAEPLLFFDFTFSAFRDAIVVRSPSDYSVMPTTFLRYQGATYSVPHRRLAFSDISIALLELQSPAGETPTNSHPGHELLVPIEG